MRDRSLRRRRTGGAACHGEPADAVRAPRDPVRVALAGNPNVGKSSLFNGLTGANQRVGNWPGKTVERRSGTCQRGGRTLVVTDLPGTYSLAACSPEEVVAEEALTSGDHDVVAVVLDSTNLERNLYLAAQVAELGVPLVLVLNLVDAADAAGLTIDDLVLARAFGAPVVRTVARTGTGLDELAAAIVTAGTSHRRRPGGSERQGRAAPQHAPAGEPAPEAGAA
jgi:ferrous iron transport protein B